MTETTRPRGSYFEEFTLGATHSSAERTILESDLFAFSELTGDHNPDGTLLAFRELAWKFSLPIFIGDTIRASARVTNLRPLARLGGGAVTFDVDVLNQRGERVQSGQWMVLVASKPD